MRSNISRENKIRKSRYNKLVFKNHVLTPEGTLVRYHLVKHFQFISGRKADPECLHDPSKDPLTVNGGASAGSLLSTSRLGCEKDLERNFNA